MVHSLRETVAKILLIEGTKHLLIEGTERLVNRTETIFDTIFRTKKHILSCNITSTIFLFKTPNHAIIFWNPLRFLIVATC